MDKYTDCTTKKGRIKVVATLLAAGVAICLIGFLRNDSKEVTLDTLNMQENIRRLSAYDHSCSTVIIGDSRVQAGIDPSVVSKFLHDGEVVNFGYASVSLGDKAYLDKVDKLFSDNAKVKRIIVGVSPFSLTASSLNWNTFKVACQEKDSENAEWLATGPFRAFDFPTIISYKRLRGQKAVKKDFSVKFHSKGWMAMDTQMSLLSGLEGYKRKFEQGQVEEDLVNTFLEKVKEWHDKGILVYGVRVPVHLKMLELENQLSGWNVPQFVTGFHDDGGCWIDFEMKYRSVDGSHLVAADAKKFSSELGEKIQNIENSDVDRVSVSPVNN